jgi:hypothetical protein
MSNRHFWLSEAQFRTLAALVGEQTMGACRGSMTAA